MVNFFSSSYACLVFCLKQKIKWYFYFKVDPTQQHDENWLFGKVGNDRQGYFPAAYAEHIP